MEGDSVRRWVVVVNSTSFGPCFAAERSTTTVHGLGKIEIYLAHNGWAVDINSKRAWSCWRDNLRGIELSLSSDIRRWEYINSFKEEGNAGP